MFADPHHLIEQFDLQSGARVADFGAPQLRERVIIIGSTLRDNFQYPSQTHCSTGNASDLFGEKLKSYLTLEDAIGDLPFIRSGEESFEYASEPKNEFQKIMRKNAPERLMDHNAPKNNAKLVKIMELLPDGGTPKDLPEEFRPASGFPNTYCRLWWQRPATTVTRNLGTPSSSRCVHPKTPRALTTREGARLQCFPDSYQFYGTRSDRNLQIGNAVPTFLSVALTKAILSSFRQEYTKNPEKISETKEKRSQSNVEIARRRLREHDTLSSPSDFVPISRQARLLA